MTTVDLSGGPMSHLAKGRKGTAWREKFRSEIGPFAMDYLEEAALGRPARGRGTNRKNVWRMRRVFCGGVWKGREPRKERTIALFTKMWEQKAEVPAIWKKQ